MSPRCGQGKLSFQKSPPWQEFLKKLSVTQNAVYMWTKILHFHKYPCAYSMDGALASLVTLLLLLLKCVVKDKLG